MAVRSFALLGWLAALGARSTAFGQIAPASCEQGYTMLRTQEDVLKLAALRCEVLHGMLVMEGPQISDLRPLAGLRKITGSLQVSSTSLESLDGLGTLTTVSGHGQLLLQGNHLLKSLAGLENLSGTVRQLQIINSMQLSNISALRGVQGVVFNINLASNPSLKSLDGLQGINSPPSLSITNLPGLESLRSLAGLRSERPVSLAISDNAGLSSLEGLEGFRRCSGLIVSGNAQLGSLLGLQNLGGPVNGTLEISWNPRLKSLRGFEGISYITELVISGNTRLRSLAALGGLRGWNPSRRGLTVTSNPELRSLHGLQHLPGLDDKGGWTIALRREVWPRTPLPGLPGRGPDFFGVYAAGVGALSASTENGTYHEAVWANETHGSIDVTLWSRQGGDPAALELRVGYLPDVQPALFLEGTVPSPAPAAENTIFPWCVDSEDCSLIAPERIEVVQCPLGWVMDAGTACARCPVGRRSANGACDWDWALLLGTGGAFAVLLAGSLMLAAQAEADYCRAFVAGLQSRKIPVQDVSREGGRVLLTTWGRHHLHMGLTKSFRVRLAATGHPGLDSPEEPLRARTISPYQLELLDARGEPLRSGSFNTSQGFMQLPLGQTSMHTGWPVPVALSAPALLAAGGCWLAWLCVWRLDDNRSDAPAWWALLVVGVAFVGSAIGPHLRGWHAEPAPLQKCRQAYDARRSNGPPAPVARGAERAITAGQLVDLHDCFQEFVRDRDMYYVVSNIVKPLTAESQLSFAEYVGPSRVDWFASHFWGTGFRHFCASIRRHAEAVGDWKCQSYWVCSFSINQHPHAVTGEVGADHRDSSFYLALQSSSCQGTCMVVDEEALPLTRSWCLFELLQTMEIEREARSGFKGLFFCTSTGVLNSGRASVETAMALGDRLAALRLQDADATVKADKAMIDGLVADAMGGFDAMNRALRRRISAALQASQDQAMKDFQLIQRKLTA